MKNNYLNIAKFFGVFLTVISAANNMLYLEF